MPYTLPNMHDVHFPGVLAASGRWAESYLSHWQPQLRVVNGWGGNVRLEAYHLSIHVRVQLMTLSVFLVSSETQLGLTSRPSQCCLNGERFVRSSQRESILIYHSFITPLHMTGFTRVSGRTLTSTSTLNLILGNKEFEQENNLEPSQFEGSNTIFPLSCHHPPQQVSSRSLPVNTHISETSRDV